MTNLENLRAEADARKGCRATEVVYRISDRQVGWLDHNDVFTPCIWKKSSDGSGFTSLPERQQNV